MSKSSFSIKLTRDWDKAVNFFNKIAIRLAPYFIAHLRENGEFVLEKMREHIDNQDLMWTPLSEKTVELKGGDTTILVETGELRNGLTVKRISTSKGMSFFVGASDTQTHHSGMSIADLMIWIEYGTDKMPPRPLIKPTLEEVRKILTDTWKDKLIELVRGI